MKKRLIAAVVLLAVAAGALYLAGVIPARRMPSGNSLLIIAPYRHAGTWAFDDSAAGVVREPFVGGMPEMLDEMVRDIPNPEHGFRLIFSAQEFPGYTHKLSWLRGNEKGNWYYCEQLEREGWLCPALFKYFPKAPREIFAKAEAK